MHKKYIWISKHRLNKFLQQNQVLLMFKTAFENWLSDIGYSTLYSTSNRNY